MKFEKDEIKRLADVINVSFDDDELEQVEKSLHELTSKLDDLLEVEVDCDPKFSGSNLNNVFNEDVDSEEGLEFLDSVNNFDGEYVSVKKVIDDEN